MFVVMCGNRKGQLWIECTLALADWPRWKEQRLRRAALDRHRIIENRRTVVVVESTHDLLTYTLEYAQPWSGRDLHTDGER